MQNSMTIKNTKKICPKSSHGEHEWIKNGQYDYCICCDALQKYRKVSLPKVKNVLVINT